MTLLLQAIVRVLVTILWRQFVSAVNEQETLSVIVTKLMKFFVCCCGLQLIQEAIDHGDTHKDTMQLADYWLLVSVHLTTKLLLHL